MTKVDERQRSAIEAAVKAAIATYEAEMAPITVRFWFMHDNHTFTEIKAGSLDGVVEAANAMAAKEPYGCLCPVSLKQAGRELPRVGPMVHYREAGAPPDAEALDAWLAACRADPRICDFFAAHGGQDA